MVSSEPNISAYSNEQQHLPKEGQSESDELTQPTRLWIPVSLRWQFFLCCACMFVCMIIALELLYRHSERSHGLVATSPRWHYFWTYGPTAVFVLFFGLLSQAEYRTKQLTPWRNMASRWSTAEQSILLNYLSPMKPLILTPALRAADYAVVLIVLSSLILTSMTIISTGLLTLGFEALEVNGTLMTVDELRLNNATIGEYNTAVGRALWAHWVDKLPLPYGTTDDFAIQSLTIPNKTYVGTIRGPATVIGSDLDCAAFDWDYVDKSRPYANESELFYARPEPSRGLSSQPSTAFAVSFWTPFCKLQNYPVQIPETFDSLPQWWGHSSQLRCTNVTEAGRSRGYDGSALYLIYSAWASTQLSSQLPGKIPNRTIHNITGVICNPSYTASKRIVEAQLGNLVNTVRVTDQYLDGPTKLTHSDFHNLTSYIHLGMVEQIGDEALNTQIVRRSTWHHMMNGSAPQESILAFDNTTLVSELSRQLFRSLGAQVIKGWFSWDKQELVDGTVLITSLRLRLLEFPVRFIEVGLGLLVAIMLFLTWAWLPRNRSINVPRDMSTVGALAILLLRSKQFRGMLRGANKERLEVLATRVQGCVFKTIWTARGFVIAVDPSEKIPGDRLPERVLTNETEQTLNYTRVTGYSPTTGTRRGNWASLTRHKTIRSLCVVLPILVIVLLEVLLWVSGKNAGLIDASKNGHKQLAWRYVPALVLSCIATLFASLNWTTRTIYPYQRLGKHGEASQSRLLWWNPFGRMALSGLYDALLDKRAVAVSATLFATLLTPLLTVVVSGLYTPEIVPYTSFIPVTQLDWFDLGPKAAEPYLPRRDVVEFVGNRTASYQDIPDLEVDVFESEEPWYLHSEVAAAEALYQKYADPQWTYQGLAFPAVQLAAGTPAQNQNTTLSVVLPAKRGRMNCSAIDHRVNGSYMINAELLPHLFVPQIRLDVPAPAPCRSLNSSSSHTLPLAANFSTMEIDQIQDGNIQYPSYEGIYAHRAGPHVDGKAFSAPEHCSIGDNRHIWYLLWRYEANTTKDITVIYCEPFVEAVVANVTFNATSFEVIREHPPKVDEMSTKAVGKFPNQLGAPRVSPGYLTDFVDNFFYAIFSERSEDQRQDLYGEENVPNLLQTMDDMYRRMMVHVLNLDLRRTISAPTSLNTTLQGSLEDLYRLRLVQNIISTRILEGLLGVLAIIAVVIWVAFPITCFLPNDPSSILARAALLADANLPHPISDETETLSDAELAQRDILKGYSFVEG